MVPIVTRNIRWPNGITLDSTSMLLYWVDAWHDQLETSDINGLFRRTFIANNLQNLHHSFGVNVQGGYVYWTDWFRRALFRRRIVPNTNDSEIESRVVNSRDRPYGFTVVDVRVPRPGGMYVGQRSCGSKVRAWLRCCGSSSPLSDKLNMIMSGS